MKISVQSLFDDYEENTIELSRETDTRRILDRTMEKLPKRGKKRTLRIVLAAAAAIAVLEVIERDALVENAAKIGDYLLAELHKIGGLKEVRGRGLMIGIEIDGSGPELRKKLLFDKHIFTGGAGASTVRLLPALCLTKEMADRFLTAFDKVKGEK